MSDDKDCKDWYDPNKWETCNEEETPFYENPRPRPIQYKQPKANLFDTPKSIFEYLDSSVYGHQEFKRQLAFFIWQIKHGHHPAALLVAGNSGEGKTETVRALQKIYKNIAVTDGASITPQGYRGNNKLASALNLLDMHNPAQPPIFVIDEVDKLICRDGWHASELTGELLKLMEDGVLDISVNDREQKFISTENVSFILLGSFSNLTDTIDSKPIGFNASIDGSNVPRRKTLTVEMVTDTLSPELQGRIGSIVVLDPFEQSDFENILRDERYSPIYRFEREYHINIHLKPGKRRQIAHDAFTNQTGVRSMTNEIARHLMTALFDDPETKEISI